MNLLAILVAAIVSMGVGALYYSPLLFAKTWMKLTGIKQSDMKKDTVWIMYLMTFGATMVLIYVLALMMNLLGVRGVMETVKLAFWLWLGFIAASSFINAIYTNKPMKLLLLENGHHLIVLLVSAVILAMWP